MKPAVESDDFLKRYHARVYLFGMIRAWLAAQEYAGIDRETAGKNFLAFIQEYGGDTATANDIIELYKFLKEILNKNPS